MRGSKGLCLSACQHIDHQRDQLLRAHREPAAAARLIGASVRAIPKAHLARGGSGVAKGETGEAPRT